MGPFARINNVLNGPFHRYSKLYVCPFSIGWMIAQLTILPLLATLNGHMERKSLFWDKLVLYHLSTEPVQPV